MASARWRFASSGNRRSLRRGVFVPPEAAGLLGAIAAARRGSDHALARWDRDVRPVLIDALERAGADLASADEAVLHLMEEAHVAICGGAEIECECAWMSAVLARAWSRLRRRHERDRVTAALMAERARAAGPIDPRRDAEHREEIEVAAARLPERFALTIRLYLRGLDTREVRTAICAELAVAPEQARRIERSSLDRMRTALGASYSDG